MHKDEEGDQQRKKNLDTVYSKSNRKHISKNPQRFLKVSSVQKKVLSPHKLQDYAYD